nr:transcription initiation factor TFIID subunit 8 [Ipomoea batatas]
MVCNGLPVASSSEVRNDAENGMGDKESKHPFPAKTLLAGEKDLSPIALPAKFSAKVHSQIYWRLFRPGKKVLGDSLNLRLWNKSFARTATWFRRDEDKDDKKRRAELILRQSMKNQQELTQLRVPVEAKHRQFLAFFQDYWNTETGWDREQLRDILPEDMMKKLDLYILSPVEEDVDDYYWTFEESGNFSISSAYALTNYGSRYNGGYDRSLGYSKGRRMGLEKKILKTNRAK